MDRYRTLTSRMYEHNTYSCMHKAEFQPQYWHRIQLNSAYHRGSVLGLILFQQYTADLLQLESSYQLLY
jgi:hypothetical protein